MRTRKTLLLFLNPLRHHHRLLPSKTDQIPFRVQIQITFSGFDKKKNTRLPLLTARSSATTPPANKMRAGAAWCGALGGGGKQTIFAALCCVTDGKQPSTVLLAINRALRWAMKAWRSKNSRTCQHHIVKMIKGWRLLPKSGGIMLLHFSEHAADTKVCYPELTIV